jgi:hypothetical protein
MFIFLDYCKKLLFSNSVLYERNIFFLKSLFLITYFLTLYDIYNFVEKYFTSFYMTKAAEYSCCILRSLERGLSEGAIS